MQAERPGQVLSEFAADDPLLDGLLLLCRLRGRASSRSRLLGCVPVPAQGLTEVLLPGAAGRAGLQGRWLNRTLAEMPQHALPALLLLRGGGALGLLERGECRARVLVVEAGGGEACLEDRKSTRLNSSHV